MKNILAISGSLRSDSSNTRILKLLGTWMPADVNYLIYDGMGVLPHFIPFAEGEPLPPQVSVLHQQLNEADALIICTPEYAFGVPGSLKNLLDWTVGTGNLVDKPVALITASSKGDDAHAALLKILSALSAQVTDALLIPFIRSRFNAEGNITDASTEAELRRVFDNLLNAINQINE
ncbi:NAD(P)H-dependent FMN reductase [Mucilaginibacter yixingensis]|uniref:NAD(P)H-dependent FMN reductase n=1 Tax=Mucilaginibacter yixingensis TaxID=1295612 RepID=A0A2T5JA76_9SPHI|nr:NADPH-dependent FMN reductase [Mucilaginibacter yixingensis]PTQ96966.1 NAD(P)H-dependent FMN reductase [Mucilaginibacter yixingensis]